jgi:hypothetical protein
MRDPQKEREEEKKRLHQREWEEKRRREHDAKEKRKQAALLKKKKKKALQLKMKKLKAAKNPPKSVMLTVLRFVFKKKKNPISWLQPAAKPTKSAMATSTADRIKQQNDEWLRKFGNLPGAVNPMEEAKKKNTDHEPKPLNPGMFPY